MELKQFQLDLITNLISYAQSDKESFIRFLNIAYGKEYPSIKKLADELENLRTEIKIEKATPLKLREGRW